MNTNELRIGNYLIDPREFSDEVMQLFKMREDGIFKVLLNDIPHAEEFKGIGLTPEVLRKCGFKFDENKGYSACDERRYDVYSFNDFDIAYIPQINKYALWFEIEDSFYNFYCTRIKFVHELQNLYFELKREELEIEL